MMMVACNRTSGKRHDCYWSTPCKHTKSMFGTESTLVLK